MVMVTIWRFLSREFTLADICEFWKIGLEVQLAARWSETEECLFRGIALVDRSVEMSISSNEVTFFSTQLSETCLVSS